MLYSPKIIVLVTDAVLAAILLEDIHKYHCDIQIVKDLPETTGLFDILVLPATYFLEQDITCYISRIIVYGNKWLMKACYQKGCHDFIKDPWDIDELACKLRYFSESPSYNVPVPVYVSGIYLIYGSQRQKLTASEKSLLTSFLYNYGSTVYRADIASALASTDKRSYHLKNGRGIDAIIVRLRKKLRNISSKSVVFEIHSVYGQGYTLVISNCG